MNYTFFLLDRKVIIDSGDLIEHSFWFNYRSNHRYRCTLIQVYLFKKYLRIKIYDRGEQEQVV